MKRFFDNINFLFNAAQNSLILVILLAIAYLAYLIFVKKLGVSGAVNILKLNIKNILEQKGGNSLTGEDVALKTSSVKLVGGVSEDVYR